MARATVLRSVAYATAIVTFGCAVRPSMAEQADPVILLKTVRLPVRSWLPWFTRFAEHTWLDFYYAGTWHRVEWNDHDYIVMQETSANKVFDDLRWERNVAVQELWSGQRAAEIAAKILPAAKRYPDVYSYRPWPGPNSNSFITWLASEVELPIVMPTTALGKDYTPWLDVGMTSSNTGVKFETMLIGTQLGVREGLELHALGLTLGVGIWPPAIKLPFLPAIPGGWFAP